MNDYIVTYRSFEHYEVLGWVRADSLDDAKKIVEEELKLEADKYGVHDAMIAKWDHSDNIHF